MQVSLPALLLQRAAAAPDRVILRRKARGIWQGTTWRQLLDQVRGIAAALSALPLALNEAVAIIAETRPETAYVDLAAQCIGAAAVPIASDTEATQIAAILNATNTAAVFVENEEQLDKLLAVRAQCPSLRRIVIFDMKGLRDFADPQSASLADFIAAGAPGFDLAAAVARLNADSPAAIVMAGGDARPRTLAQRDVMRLVARAGERLALTAQDERLAILGMADPVERIWGLYAALDAGCVSNYLEGPDTALENLQELQPTVLGADAEAWGHLHARASRAAEHATFLHRVLYNWAARGGGLLARLLVMRPVRREFGLARLRVAYTGGNPVSPQAVAWARAMGIAIQPIDDGSLADSHPDTRHDPALKRAHA